MKELNHMFALILRFFMPVIILFIFCPLSGLDLATAQGMGQGGSTTGIMSGSGIGGGMGLGNLIGATAPLSLSGISNMGALGVGSPLGLGMTLGGGIGMNTLGQLPYMSTGQMMTGLGTSSTVGLGSPITSPLLFGPLGGGMPFIAPIPQPSNMLYPSYGMMPVMPYMNMLSMSPYFNMSGYYRDPNKGISYYDMMPMPIMPYMNTPYMNILMAYPYFGNIPIKPIIGNVFAGGYSDFSQIFALSPYRTAMGETYGTGGFTIPTIPYVPWALFPPTHVPFGMYAQVPSQAPGLFVGWVDGYVYDEDYNIPLQGVTVSVETDSTISAITDINGRYSLTMHPDDYTLVYNKDGYEIQKKDIIVLKGNNLQPPVYMKPKDMPHQNNPPVLQPIDPINVIAGQTVTLEPQAYDPDSDELTFTYSGGWMTQSTYTTTQEDIGQHEVTITVFDPYEASDTQSVLITVHKGYTMELYVGFNLISYPFEDGDSNFTAYDLLQMLGDDKQIQSVESHIQGRAYYDEYGQPSGDDFYIEIGEGYIVYAKEDQDILVFDQYTGEIQSLNLIKGMNLIGIASYPEGYTSYKLLQDLGYGNVESIYCYDAYQGDWLSTYWLNGVPSGDEFQILIGKGYMIQMKVDKDFVISRQRSFSF